MSAIDVRDDLIDEIRTINRAASCDYLRAFSYDALVEYLQHLRLTLEPRLRSPGWVRKDTGPAISTRVPPDF
jgi:hypothetical protein